MTTPADIAFRTLADRPLEPDGPRAVPRLPGSAGPAGGRARLRDKVDLSGVVQQTLLEAHQGLIEHPRSERTAAEVAGWLRSILSHNLADVLRKLTARKRDFRREWSLESALDQSASRLEQWLAAEQSSPSQQAIRQEELLRMAESLADAARRPAPRDRAASPAGRPLAEIAAELGTTKAAVAGLLHRGLKRCGKVWNR